jgi:predicted amidophosphoribosyltransferase
LGRILQDALSRALATTNGPPIDVVLPVPLHPRKLRRRGFNQALELARVALGLLRDRSPRSMPFPALERQLLLRTRNTRELGRSGPGARRVEVEGAFGVSDARHVAGRRFLVVDDVMTTGATLNECAQTLVRAGAAEVRVVALARAV